MGPRKASERPLGCCCQEAAFGTLCSTAKSHLPFSSHSEKEVHQVQDLIIPPASRDAALSLTLLPTGSFPTVSTPPSGSPCACDHLRAALKSAPSDSHCEVKSPAHCHLFPPHSLLGHYNLTYLHDQWTSCSGKVLGVPLPSKKLSFRLFLIWVAFV